jgi:hypothetical protein
MCVFVRSRVFGRALLPRAQKTRPRAPPPPRGSRPAQKATPSETTSEMSSSHQQPYRARGRGRGAHGRGGGRGQPAAAAARPPPVGPYDAQEHPREILQRVAAALGLAGLPEPSIALWSLNMQSVTLPSGETRDYGVVSHNPTAPDFLCDAARDQARVALAAATGVVITSPYQDGEVRVVRRAMPPMATAIAWSAEACDARTGGLTTIHNAHVPSVTQLAAELPHGAGAAGAVAALAIHPRAEGVKVYVWKHASEIFFSTRRTINAQLSRAAEAARLNSELWYACGGVPLHRLFPAEMGPDGGGLARVFVLCHQSVRHTSKVPVGGGYIVFLGSVVAETGLVIEPGHPNDPLTAALQLRENDACAAATSLPRPPAPPPSVGWTTVARECDAAAAAAGAGAAAAAGSDHSGQRTIADLDDILNQEHAAADHEAYLSGNDSGYAVPFPPPCGAPRALPATGAAAESARRCLFGPYGDGEEENHRIFASPRFTLPEANAHMLEGFWTDTRACARGIDPAQLAECRSRVNTAPGESIIVCATFARPELAPFGHASFNMRLVPGCEVYRLGLFGNGTNVRLRAHELRTLADQALGAVLELQARGPFHGCPPTYDLFFASDLLRRLMTRRDGAGIQSMTYSALVGLPQMDQWERGLATPDGRAALAAFADELAAHDGDPLLELPPTVYARLLECAAALGPRRLLDHEVRTVLFGHACIRLAVAGSHASSVAALRAFTAMDAVEREVAEFAAHTLAPLLGSPPRRENAAAVFSAIRVNPALCDPKGVRVKPRAAALVEVAQSVAYRCSLGEADAVGVALSAVRIRGGEEVYGMHRYLADVRAAIAAAAFPPAP